MKYIIIAIVSLIISVVSLVKLADADPKTSEVKLNILTVIFSAILSISVVFLISCLFATWHEPF